jgi:hypothetical protein
MSDDYSDIEDTTNLINQDALTPTVLTSVVPIKYLTSTSTRQDGTTYNDFIEENTNLSKFIPSFTGFAQVPSGTSDLRGMFNDLNGLLVEELKRKNPNKVTLSSTTKTNCNNKGWRTERSKIHSRYNNMCFYCGKTCKKKLQCDHVIPIMQMYVSLERNDSLFYNFERVHSQCNNAASNMTLNEIWQKIGTRAFPGPHNESFVLLNVKKGGTLIKDYNVNSVDRQAICRGYLGYNILSKLIFSPLEIQRVRALLMKDVVNKYLEFKTLAGKLLSEQGTVAQSLIDFSQPITPSYKRPRTSFGSSGIKLLNVIPSELKDKKWTAIFSKNSKIVKTHFGAKGMSDYTIHKDIDRRNRYISRHLKDLDTNDPKRAGYLSMFVLWNKPSFSASVKDYKTRLSIYNQTGKFPNSITGYSKLSKFGTPTNVINKTLYKKVKEQIKSGIKGRRWGAYDSGRLVQMYKQLGGKYSGTKKETPLERWYKEKWVNACKWPQVVPCGRSDMTNKMAYCRPSVKVTKNTPKTVQSLTQAQINKRCTIKEKTPLVRISGKLKV